MPQGQGVRVMVRVRPMLPRELSYDAAVEVTSPDKILVYRSNAEFKSSYNHVFSEHAKQEEVYQQVRSGVLSAMQGFNSTCMAYGQTGAGKTYTMMGPHDIDLLSAKDPALMPPNAWASVGVVPRALADLFMEVEATRRRGSAKVQVVASYVEIHNDRMYDLLQPYKKGMGSRDPYDVIQRKAALEIQEDKNGSTHVPSLLSVQVPSYGAVLQLLAKGNNNRAVRHTEMNVSSSRSHAILQLLVEQWPGQAEAAAGVSSSHGISGEAAANMLAGGRQGSMVVRSKINFIDLAGSERWNKDTDMGSERINELTFINSSLSALAGVVSALTEGVSRKHVPYRNSKLTSLLQDSLGGNCNTTIIATISPCVNAFEQTVSTLKFADRARSIANNPVINTSRDMGSMLALKEKEIQRLRMLLATYMQQQQEQQQEQQQQQHQQQQFGQGLASATSAELTSSMNSGLLSAGASELLSQLEAAKSALEAERQRRQAMETRLQPLGPASAQSLPTSGSLPFASLGMSFTSDGSGLMVPKGMSSGLSPSSTALSMSHNPIPGLAWPSTADAAASLGGEPRPPNQQLSANACHQQQPHEFDYLCVSPQSKSGSNSMGSSLSPASPTAPEAAAHGSSSHGPSAAFDRKAHESAAVGGHRSETSKESSKHATALSGAHATTSLNNLRTGQRGPSQPSSKSTQHAPQPGHSSVHHLQQPGLQGMDQGFSNIHGKEAWAVQRAPKASLSEEAQAHAMHGRASRASTGAKGLHDLSLQPQLAHQPSSPTVATGKEFDKVARSRPWSTHKKQASKQQQQVGQQQQEAVEPIPLTRAERQAYRSKQLQHVYGSAFGRLAAANNYNYNYSSSSSSKLSRSALSSSGSSSQSPGMPVESSGGGKVAPKPPGAPALQTRSKPSIYGSSRIRPRPNAKVLASANDAAFHQAVAAAHASVLHNQQLLHEQQQQQKPQLQRPKQQSKEQPQVEQLPLSPRLRAAAQGNNDMRIRVLQASHRSSKSLGSQPSAASGDLLYNSSDDDFVYQQQLELQQLQEQHEELLREQRQQEEEQLRQLQEMRQCYQEEQQQLQQQANASAAEGLQSKQGLSSGHMPITHAQVSGQANISETDTSQKANTGRVPATSEPMQRWGRSSLLSSAQVTSSPLSSSIAAKDSAPTHSSLSSTQHPLAPTNLTPFPSSAPIPALGHPPSLHYHTGSPLIPSSPTRVSAANSNRNSFSGTTNLSRNNNSRSSRRGLPLRPARVPSSHLLSSLDTNSLVPTVSGSAEREAGRRWGRSALLAV